MPASTCCRRTPHDLPNHKSEFGKSPIERVGNIDIQHDPSGQPQCALRLSEPVKSSLYPSALRRVKRTHAANQMKRVQRVEDSLAQSGARPQCGFHLLPQRTPRGKHRKVDMLAQKRTLPRRRLRSPRPFVLRRDRLWSALSPTGRPGWRTFRDFGENTSMPATEPAASARNTARRTAPARTIPPAGAKTGQTRHPDGPQFTNPSFTLTYRRVSADKRPADVPSAVQPPRIIPPEKPRAALPPRTKRIPRAETRRI